MQTTRIKLSAGLLIGRHNHPAGAVVEVDADRARSLIESGHAVKFSGNPEQAPPPGQAPRRPRTASAAPAGRTAAITTGRAAP